jgi:hypothetical protein
MPLTERPYSYLVDSILPSFIVEQYPQYVAFLKTHFKALEEESGPVAVLYDITKHIDISRCDEEDLVHFIYQYLHSFPGDLIETIDVRQFVQNSKSFYSMKGTENSFQFIFNLLNGSMEIYYPSEDIFHLNTSCLSGKARYITSVNGSKSNIFFTTKIYHGASVGDRITVSGTVNYNGSFFITEIINETTFKVDTTEHNFSTEYDVGIIAFDQLHYLHDNNYYAYYVYEITTDLDEDKYNDIVDGLVHPVGTKRFYKREEFDNFLKFHYEEASQYIAIF